MPNRCLQIKPAKRIKNGIGRKKRKEKRKKRRFGTVRNEK